MTQENKYIQPNDEPYVVKSHDIHIDSDYADWIADIKNRYRSAQVKAAVKVNAEKLLFNWELGRDLVQKKAEERWGTGVVEQVSLDLNREFPDSTNFSVRNLWYMKQWYLFYAENPEKLKRLVSVMLPDDSLLFNMSRFEELNGLGDIDKIKDIHKSIISIALKQINSHLLIAKKELRIISNSFVLSDIGEKSVIETPKVRIVTYQYIRELPERIKEDLSNKDYDSVITKSRTLLEEVLIYVIEQLTKERYKSNGDLIKIYQEATDLLNMRQKKEWDKRVNELLSGLHKIVSSISSMRNINSDAHGVGASRISISEREALLVANSAIMLAEYWLGVFEKK